MAPPKRIRPGSISANSVLLVSMIDYLFRLLPLILSLLSYCIPLLRWVCTFRYRSFHNCLKVLMPIKCIVLGHCLHISELLFEVSLNCFLQPCALDTVVLHYNFSNLPLAVTTLHNLPIRPRCRVQHRSSFSSYGARSPALAAAHCVGNRRSALSGRQGAPGWPRLIGCPLMEA